MTTDRRQGLRKRIEALHLFAEEVDCGACSFEAETLERAVSSVSDDDLNNLETRIPWFGVMTGHNYSP